MLGWTSTLICCLMVLETIAAMKPIGWWYLNDKFDRPFKDMTGKGLEAVGTNVMLDAESSTSLQKSIHFGGEETSVVVVQNKHGALDVNSFTLMFFIDPDGVVENDVPIITLKSPGGETIAQISLAAKGTISASVFNRDDQLLNSNSVKGLMDGFNLVAISFNHRNGRLDIRVAEKTKKARIDPEEWQGEAQLRDVDQLFIGADSYDSENSFSGYLTCLATFGAYVDVEETEWGPFAAECFDAKITCDNLECGENQVCSEIEGVAQCVCEEGFINIKGACEAHGLCTVSGDPHGHSFDGKHNKFQGACTYTWAMDGCVNGIPDEEAEPRFIVATKNWRRDELVRVSWVKEVLVYIDDYEITLKQNGVVFLNGEVTGLPIYVNDDIHIYEKPNYVYVRTSFGLTVMWDRSFSVRISITADYKRKVCGMCGNFDGNPENDWIVGPNTHLCSMEMSSSREVGEKTKFETPFGVSWMFGNDTSLECLSDCRPPPVPHCTDEERDAAHANCSSLIDVEGPLEDCIAALGDVRVKEIFKNCIYDECSASFNGTAVVCGDAGLMADECSVEAGIHLIWRSKEYCPLPCPANAFYTTCMTECLPTCGDETGSDCIPTGICSEGCQCEEGFIFSDGECIRPDECGCVDPDTGGIVPIGGTILKGDCDEKCKCPEHGKPLSCKANKCKNGQKCFTIDGVKQCACPPWHGEHKGECVAPPTCRCSGDPHCYSFDGGHFSYQGSCNYLMAQDGCSDGLPGSPPSYQVLINNDRMLGKKLASVIHDVIVILPNMSLTVVLHQGGMVSLNGNEITLPFYRESLFISASGSNIILGLAAQLLVRWDKIYSIQITVPGTSLGKVCGMCGQFNMDKKDDMIMGPAEECIPGVDIDPGTQIDDEVILGSSWFHSRDVGDKSCDADCKKLPYPPKCNNKRAKKLCSQLSKSSGPLGPCIKKIGKVAAKAAFYDCLFDTCVLSEVSDKYACSAAEQMTQECEENHGLVLEWRSNKFCPAPCPEHSKYLVCGNICQPTCDDPEGKRCTGSASEIGCARGCYCDPGFIMFDNGECRPVAECAVMRKPCMNMNHPETGELYSARVECLTCKKASSDEACREMGTWETCRQYNAICALTRQTKKDSVLISRGCQARSDCPLYSVGEDLCESSKGGEVCQRCDYFQLGIAQTDYSVFRCKQWVNRDACAQKRDQGKGKTRSQRYYFSASKCRCLPFEYRGTGGTENNFLSQDACDDQCGNWVLPERCLLPQDNGTGKAKAKMFFFNAKKNRCKKFRFNGEGGNDNRFRSKKECQQACLSCGAL